MIDKFEGKAIADALVARLGDVSRSYAGLLDATEIAKDYAVALSGAKIAHEEARQTVILAHKDAPKGEGLGSNDLTREAILNFLTHDTLDALRAAERSALDTSHAVKVAQLKLDAAKTTLRVYESIAALVAAMGDR